MTHGILKASMQNEAWASAILDPALSFVHIADLYERINGTAGAVFEKSQFDSFVKAHRNDPFLCEQGEVAPLADLITGLIGRFGVQIKILQKSFEIPPGYGDVYENYRLYEIAAHPKVSDKMAGIIQAGLLD